jgi:hypothetical protein
MFHWSGGNGLQIPGGQAEGPRAGPDGDQLHVVCPQGRQAPRRVSARAPPGEARGGREGGRRRGTLLFGAQGAACGCGDARRSQLGNGVRSEAQAHIVAPRAAACSAGQRQLSSSIYLIEGIIWAMAIVYHNSYPCMHDGTPRSTCIDYYERSVVEAGASEAVHATSEPLTPSERDSQFLVGWRLAGGAAS